MFYFGQFLLFVVGLTFETGSNNDSGEHGKITKEKRVLGKMVDKSLFEDPDFLLLLKNTQKNFYLNSLGQNNEELVNELSSKQQKMIKLLALYIVTNKDHNVNVVENIKLLYKGKHIFDWLEEKDHDFYKVLDYFKKRYTVILDESNKLFTLRNFKNHKIDTNHPLYKQILFKQLYVLALGKERETYLKIKAGQQNKTIQHHSFITQSIDWLKIIEDAYREEDSEKMNNGHDFTIITLPSLDEVLPTLANSEMKYNLDIKGLKKMKSKAEKTKLVDSYFKDGTENHSAAVSRKRKLGELEPKSWAEQQEPRKKTAAKRKTSRKVVMDPSMTRADIDK